MSKLATWGRRSLVLVLALSAGWNLGQGLYIEAKARLAQLLLQQAWDETRQGVEKARPWAWADTWPVARLRQPRLDVDQIVLAGASGRTLAFGPGYLFGSAAPGSDGHSIISGHRDTHFGFLKDLQLGDRLEVTNSAGEVIQYAVYQREVMHENSLERLQVDDARLTLITCYPFDVIQPGTDQRYVVTARPVLM